MTEITRKLASVRRIDAIRPIPNADAIEAAVIGGWVVVVKKGEFAVGDFAVYFEIDSWVPHAVAPFLTSETRPPRVFNEVFGERLRTAKLRGQISQGLLLPLSILAEFMTTEQYTELNVNLFAYMDEHDSMDVTAVLGVQKWELPMNAQLAGEARSTYPSTVPKTDQERVQNLRHQVRDWYDAALVFEVTEKLDGSSCTFYLDPEGEFHVCSRNIDLKEAKGNAFWDAAKAADIEAKMRAAWLLGIAIQGELIGEGIQGNQFKLKGHRFYAFDVYSVLLGEYLNSTERHNLVQRLGLNHAPVIAIAELETADVEALILAAEGASLLNQSHREGLVFKCIDQPHISFKTISNKWLLKQE